jgi:TRAP-type mannitol/chloroaromatic compound transport system permease small subunit
MKMLSNFLFGIDFINEWLGRIVSFLCIVLMFTISYDVVMRYIFNDPTDWQMEMSQFLMLTMVCIGAGYTELHKKNVNVTLLHERWSPRTRAIVDLVTHQVAIVVILVLLWYGGQIFWQNYQYDFRTSSAWAPVQWPAKMMIPLAGILLGIQLIAKLIRCMVFAISGVELGSRYATKEE